MSSLKVRKLGSLAALTALLAFGLAQGCSSDDAQSAPTGGAGKSSAGAGGKTSGTSGAGGKTSGGAGKDSSNDAGDGNNTDQGGAGGDTGPGPGGDAGQGGEGGGGDEGPVCTDPKDPEFLKGCVDGHCPAHFDNSTLTKLNLVGTL